MADFRLGKKNNNGGQSAKQTPQSPPQTLLSKAGDLGMSGLHTVGSILSTPSRMLWGTVNAAAGGQGGFGNVNPFDSTGGIELSHVLGNAGVIAKNDPTKWELGDFGRGVVDMLGDPTSYIGIGALSKGGQAAVKGGRLAPGIVNQIRQGQRGLIGAQIPFVPSTAITLGTGPRVAGALDSAGVTRGLAAAHASAPAVKMRQLFHASVGGRKTAKTQEAYKHAYDEQGNLIEAADMATVNAARNMQLAPGGPRDPEVERHLVEMRRPSDEIRPLKNLVDDFHRQKMDLGIPTGELDNPVKAYEKLGPKQALKTHVLDERGNIAYTIDNTKSGTVKPTAGPVNFLRPNQRVEHANRYIAEGTEWGGVAGRGSQIAMDAQANIDQKRNVELFGNASTDLINRVFREAGKHLETLPATLTENQKAREIGRFIKRQFREEDLRAGTNLTGNYFTGSRNANVNALKEAAGQAATDSVMAHSRPRELGQFIVRNPQLTKAGPFTNHPVHDMHTALRSGSEQIPKARNAIRFMAENAKIDSGETLDVLRANKLDNPPTILDAAKQLSLNPDRVIHHTLNQLPPTTLAQVNKNASDEAMRQARHQISQGSGRKLTDIANDLVEGIRDKMVLNLQLPAKEFDSLIGFREPITRKQDGILGSLNTIWKANMLAHPATQVRNALSATVTSAMQGPQVARGLPAGVDLVRGKNVSGLASHPDVAALMASQGIDETEAVRRLAAVHFPVNNSVTGDLPAGQIGSTLQDLQANVPGRTKSKLSDIITEPAKAAVGYRDGQHVGINAANPLAIAGAFGRETTDYGPAMAANMAARNIEQPIRIGSLIGLMKDGYSAREAAKKVGQAQVNYGNREFSDFEKLIKQVIPFYSFNSRAGRYVAGELASNPGGPMGQSIKAQDRANAVDPSLPDSLVSGTAIPLGTKKDGTKTLLSGLGLAHEPAVQTLGSMLSGDVRGAGYDVLGMLNPMLKTPLEGVTGQTFFKRGEDQLNLDPNIGRTLSNIGVMAGLRDAKAGPVKFPGSSLAEAAVSISPFSRILSTVKGLTDTRKSAGEKILNATTGFKITDVSPKTQEYTLMRRAEKLAKEAGAKSRADVYFNKKELEQLEKSDPAAAARQKQLQQILNEIKSGIRSKAVAESKPKSAKSSYNKKGEFRIRKPKK